MVVVFCRWFVDVARFAHLKIYFHCLLGFGSTAFKLLRSRRDDVSRSFRCVYRYVGTRRGRCKYYRYCLETGCLFWCPRRISRVHLKVLSFLAALTCKHDPLRRGLKKKALSQNVLIKAHAQWLFCTGAFWESGEKCTLNQKYAPEGYFFETGRFATGPCGDLQEADLVEVSGCELMKGTTIVMPAVTAACFAQVGRGGEQPAFTPGKCKQLVEDLKGKLVTVAATLDGNNVPSTFLSNTGNIEINIVFNDKECPYPVKALGAPAYQPQTAQYAAPWVFIDTTGLNLGEHTIVLIGEETTTGLCSGVKLVFNLV